VQFGEAIVDVKTWIEVLSKGAMSVVYHYVDTTPAEDEIIASTDSEFHYYYIADQKALGTKQEGETFEIFTDIPVVSNFVNVNGEGCVVASDGWIRYQEPYKVLTVEENGVYNTEDV
jgi:hypothetical protein